MWKSGSSFRQLFSRCFYFITGKHLCFHILSNKKVYIHGNIWNCFNFTYLIERKMFECGFQEYLSIFKAKEFELKSRCKGCIVLSGFRFYIARKTRSICGCSIRLQNARISKWLYSLGCFVFYPWTIFFAWN